MEGQLISADATFNKPRRRKMAVPLYLMILPAFVLTFVFSYLPMAGLVIAFQEYNPSLGFAAFFDSPWVGLDQFRLMFEYDPSKQAIRNTVIIASLKIFLQLVTPFVFALLLNEVKNRLFKRSVQTLVYLPHFMSWVLLGGILTDVLGENGFINHTLHSIFGLEPVPFLLDGDWYRATIIVSDIWKEFGFGAIVFLATLAGIDPTLYEAAEIDGANRWKQVTHITVPSLIPITIVVATLAMGNILNAGFDQIFNTYNPMVMAKGDIIDTYVYRQGILGGQFSFSTAVGMFKSVISLALIVIGYRLAYRYANYRIF